MSVDYWFFLFATIIVELLLAAFLTRSNDQIETKWLALVIAGVNLISHPSAWFIWEREYLGYFWIEAVVVIFEAALIRISIGSTLRYALGLSLVMNFVSAAIGWLF